MSIKIPKTNEMVISSTESIPLTLNSDASTIEGFLHDIENSVSNEPLENLLNNTIMITLLSALQWGIEQKNDAIIRQSSKIILQIAKKSPDRFIACLNTTITLADQSQQTLGDRFINQLYAATYDPENDTAIICIHYILYYLVENSLTNQIITTFCHSTELHHSPLLTLILALSNASQREYNQSNSILITKLLLKVIEKSPLDIGRSLTQIIAREEFKGKSALYFLISALHSLSQNNLEANNLLCDYLILLNRSEIRISFMEAISSPIVLGPYRGMCSLHILLHTLTTVVYLISPTNPDYTLTAMKLAELLDEIAITHPVQMTHELLKDIKMGIHAKETGLGMLIRAFCVAAERNIDTSNLSAIIYKTIELNTIELLSCLVKIGDAKYQNETPLYLLIQGAKNPLTQNIFLPIIAKLATSEFALELMMSLEPNDRIVLLNEYSKNNALSEEQKAAILHEQRVNVSHELIHVQYKNRFFPEISPSPTAEEPRQSLDSKPIK